MMELDRGLVQVYTGNGKGKTTAALGLAPDHLLEWLNNNKPEEELVLSHGDFCLPNIFIDGKTVTGFIDIGRGGISDKWQDIALCVRSLNYNLRHTDQQKYINLLFTYLGIQLDEAKIRYYILLDELF
jgi:kanamycin kinase/aminoglycoside 3'-phosphotransferase-3